jgi:signal transduction histidine kinase
MSELTHKLECRDEELHEAREQQAATAEILKVINASPGDLTPVFDVILEKAHSLCDVPCGSLQLFDDAHTRAVAVRGMAEPFEKFLRQGYRLDRNQPVQSARSFQIDDLAKMPADGSALQLAFELGGLRTLLSVPLVRDGVAFGRIVAGRQEVRPFSEHQIALLQGFADQAVIAIENARLFTETREALARQIATADILKVIASSPSDVAPVFEAIATRANSLLGGFSSTVFRFIDGMAHLEAFTPTNPEADQFLQSTFPRPVADFAPFQMTQSGEVMHIPDAEALTDEIKDIARARGFRSMLFAPLINKGASIGFVAVTRVQPGGFSDHHVQLLRTFADQAVIAIENTRLFEEVEARTRQLSQSLDDLRTAQDRLIQTEKLASLGQLTAGIAHEIKNPLNFVNNFSALSVELTQELDETLKQASLAAKIRAEVDELTGLLKDNLGKVVQHGKRADSIVKNMLLHSREGSGEHHPADVNALVNESLNLAYHGARAEKPQFMVTLARHFDPDAGAIEVFSQEITRVLLNLISNSFYAVTKRRAENGAADFEPLVTASTRGYADRVEIHIRDNGTGIPPDVKEKLFNPFFTTKPAGEGTGLGLSISHDIIVKQHGGTIEVDTEAGEFTEFTIVLPRKGNLSGKTRGQM